MKKHASPKFSIIVVTKNRHKLLFKSLRALANQTKYTQTPIEIILIDGSTNKMPQDKSLLSKHHYKVRHIRLQKKGISLARNFGISLAQGQYICFVDDDTIVDKNWLRSLERVTKKFPHHIVFGQIIPTFEKPVNENILSSVEGVTPWILTSVKANNPKSIWPYAVNVSIPRKIFSTHGVFSELFANEEGPIKHPYGEDPEFFARVISQGADIHFEPTLQCYHHLKSDRLSMAYLFTRYIDDGKNSVLGFIYETRRIQGGYIAKFILRDLFTVITQNKWSNPYTYLYVLTKFLGECLMCIHLVQYYRYYRSRI